MNDPGMAQGRVLPVMCRMTQKSGGLPSGQNIHGSLGRILMKRSRNKLGRPSLGGRRKQGSPKYRNTLWTKINMAIENGP